jgi:hypothetical protein
MLLNELVEFIEAFCFKSDNLNSSYTYYFKANGQNIENFYIENGHIENERIEKNHKENNDIERFH